jgi:hypothetical protein
MRNLDLRSRSVSLRESRFIRFSALHLVAAGLIATTLPADPAAAVYSTPPFRSSTRDYQKCAAGLLGAGVAETDAADACGGALYPRDLSSCVTEISSQSGIAINDALSGCRRVRRPPELASCVVGINKVSSEGTVILNVLDNCRRSLLPVRFSNCVVGLRNQADTFSTEAAMTSCIAASQRPREVLPSFIPRGEELPSVPLPGSSDIAPTPMQTQPPQTNNEVSPPAQSAPPAQPSSGSGTPPTRALW